MPIEVRSKADGGPEKLIPVKEAVRDVGTDIILFGGPEFLATDSFHGKLVLFTGVCTITIPAGLRSDFSMGWVQYGAGVLTFAAGAGATVQSQSSYLVSTGQYGVGGVASLGGNVHLLYGALGEA